MQTRTQIVATALITILCLCQGEDTIGLWSEAKCIFSARELVIASSIVKRRLESEIFLIIYFYLLFAFFVV